MPPASSPLPAITLARGKRGDLEVEVPAPGDYTVHLADGRSSSQGKHTAQPIWSRSFQAGPLPAPLEISGPWQVRFPVGMDVPERLSLDQLKSLTEHTNEAIRYFSGTVAYEGTFDLPDEPVETGQRLWLDLGRVEPLAEVSLNGKCLGVLWKPPFGLDITDAARPGMNRLEVRVTGTWRNRLIGDAKYPSGFPSADGHPQFKPWLGVGLKLSPDETPAPFGLLGPVLLRTTQRVSLSP
jgi:hypothetical protein